MQQMIELHPRADTLDVLGLPAIPYPVALPVFQAAVANDGELPLADMLHGLQVRAADAAAWERLEPAMARLAELLAPADPRDVVTTRGDDWWLEIGPVALEGELVAIHRGQSLLAAICDRGDGRLRMAAWRPLDADAIRLLVSLASVPGTVAGAAEAPGSWKRALDASAGRGQQVADGEGRACLAHWRQGPGSGGDDGVLADWRAQAESQPRRPACVAAEIGTWYTLHD